MNLQENIPVKIKRRIHIIDRVINNLLPNMYPCDYNSTDHFVTGVLHEIRWYLIDSDSEQLTGIKGEDIENYILDYKYDELVEYFNERCVVLKESERPQYQIRRERFQKLVDNILNNMKRTCEIMNSEDDEIISFGACELIDADVKVSVSEVGVVNDRMRVLVVIKYHHWRYIGEDEFVYELSKELRKWIGDNYVEVEDYINTYPTDKRQW